MRTTSVFVVAAAAAALATVPATGSSAAACTGQKLSAVARFQGATGAAEGGVTVVNRGTRVCTLSGRAVIGFTAGGRSLFVQVAPGVSTSGSRRLARLQLKPRGRAFVHTRWSNWCAKRYRAVAVRLGVRSGGSLVKVRGTVAPPRCDDVKRVSTIAIGPYEPLAQPAAAASP